MKKKIMFIGIIYLMGSFILSCSETDKLKNPIDLSGVYVEVTPRENEHTFNFIDSENFIISSSSHIQYKGTYMINNDKMILTFKLIGSDTCDDFCTEEFEIEIIDDSKFITSNFLYSSITIVPLPNQIIFKKKI